MESSETENICSNCRKEMCQDILYVCSSGHIICRTCNLKLARCLLCLKSILDSPQFYCKYRKAGCNYKASLSYTRCHENDCDFQEIICPFAANNCHFMGLSQQLIIHLVDYHKDDIVVDEIVTGDVPTRDQNLIVIAYGEVTSN